MTEQTYNPKCYGRDNLRKDVLESPVEVKVTVRQIGNSLLGVVECPFKTGEGGKRCNARQRESETFGETGICPYTFSIPEDFERTSLGITNNHITINNSRVEIKAY